MDFNYNFINSNQKFNIMKRLLFISLFFISCTGNTKQPVNATPVSYQEQLIQAKSDTLLVEIQSKIYNTFVQSLMSQNDQSLTKLSGELEQLYQSKKQNLILYWRSYLQFYSSIFYLKKNDNKTAEKEIDKGIDWLKEMKNKNSEDYALLAMLQGFGIQFKGMKAMFISSDIKKMLIKP